MSSNSVRISNELFRDAQSTGEIVSRSAAQQVEYWARLGKALEEAGLSMPEIIEVLRVGVGGQAMKTLPSISAVSAEFADAKQMWSEKRAKQAKDIQNVKDGKASSSSMGWFSAKRIKQIKLIDSPY
ncbi:hypothetical protein [Roseateles sp.]|uniref:TA system antitoxin ParD family protein n=1 Tax=Roseateles sp. TaxID=1971397 RepID=UPI0031DF0B6F